MAVAPSLGSSSYPEGDGTGPRSTKKAGRLHASAEGGATFRSRSAVVLLEDPLQKLYSPQVRAAALLLLILEIGYVAANCLGDPGGMASLWQLHLANFAIALILLLFSFTPPSVRRLWREATLFACVSFIANTAAISIHGGTYGDLFIVAIAIMISSSSLAPWSAGCQALVSAAGLLAFTAASQISTVADPALWPHWFGLLVAMVIAQVNVAAHQRSRRAIEAHLEALEEAHHEVLVQAAERERTERSAAEHQAALEQSEETLRKLFDASLDAMALSEDGTGSIIDVNREFLRVSGYARDEVIGRNTLELGLWSNDEQRRRFMRQLRERGEVPDLEIDLRVKDGRVVPCLVSAVTVRVGARTLVFAMTRDISERKGAERKLTENTATLRKLFEASPDVITINRMSDGTYVDVSDSFGRTGFRPEEAAGRSAAEIGLWADRRQLKRFINTLDERGFVRGMEIDIRTKEGAIVPNLISATIVEVNGEPCVASFTRDISRLKRTENELRAAREAAMAASRAKSDFLSSVSHEIRTPMNAILGMADLMRETELSSAQRRYLDAIASNGAVLLDLISGILDLARVESGRLVLESVEFDLIGLVEKAADSLAVSAHEKGIELALRFTRDIPQRVIGDPMRLRQVLTNLIANAVKFTERGEVVITAGPNPDGKGPGSVRFTLSDTGIGIPAEQHSREFCLRSRL